MEHEAHGRAVWERSEVVRALAGPAAAGRLTDLQKQHLVNALNDLAKQRFEKDPDRYADPKVLPQLKNAK